MCAYVTSTPSCRSNANICITYSLHKSTKIQLNNRSLSFLKSQYVPWIFLGANYLCLFLVFTKPCTVVPLARSTIPQYILPKQASLVSLYSTLACPLPSHSGHRCNCLTSSTSSQSTWGVPSRFLAWEQYSL